MSQESSSAAYFRRQAADARAMAEKASNDTARENWLAIARQWDMLAKDADQQAPGENH